MWPNLLFLSLPYLYGLHATTKQRCQYQVLLSCSIIAQVIQINRSYVENEEILTNQEGPIFPSIHT